MTKRAMNLNDPVFLRSASALIQWGAIVLAALAVGLQTLKHFVDLREKRMTSQLAARKDEAQQAREKDLHEKLDKSRRLIRSLEVEIKYEMIAKWKNGKAPDPGEFIHIGGGGWAVSMIISSSSGKQSEVQFFDEQQIAFLPKENDATEISYRSVASPRSDIFELTADEIDSISNVKFTCVGANPGSLIEQEFTLKNVQATFFANGKQVFEAILSTSATTVPSQNPGSSDYILHVQKLLPVTHL